MQIKAIYHSFKINCDGVALRLCISMGLHLTAKERTVIGVCFQLARKIDEVETSWALGATFHYIESLRSQ